MDGEQRLLVEEGPTDRAWQATPWAQYGVNTAQVTSQPQRGHRIYSTPKKIKIRSFSQGLTVGFKSTKLDSRLTLTLFRLEFLNKIEADFLIQTFNYFILAIFSFSSVCLEFGRLVARRSTR